ncbi:MAG: rRNA pseudouridine synthase [Candidatus Peregrinibacteria bacterium]|nr:rRNA pseudouridine synthase [Candidatus Peregrinibacteria bacterium]
MEKKRLQKLLSEIGYCSRRNAEELIRARKIKINGKIATLGDKVTGEEIIEANGQILTQKRQKKVVIAFNKPVNVESTFAPTEGKKTLLDFDFGRRVFNVGRLDRDSHGLLLLTNDGELCNELAHPRFGHEKEYLVSVDKKLTPSLLKKLSDGSIEILAKSFKNRSDKTFRVKECLVEKVSDKGEGNIFRIVLTEGRNRQIRKMCESLDLKVLDLLRIRFANIHLGELPAGKHRVLSEVEVRKLKQ